MNAAALSASDITAAIASGQVQFDAEQLTALQRALLNVSVAVRREARANFSWGQRVEFTHNGNVITGTVERVNPKSIGVRGDDGKPWRVSPVYLRQTDVPPPPGGPVDPMAEARAKFEIGQPVRFKGRRGVMVDAVIDSFNQTSVTVKTATGAGWRVAPNLLQAVA